MKNRIAATVLITLAIVVLPGPPADAHDGRIGTAATWLSEELEADGYALTTTSGGFTFDDWGLTIDFILALAAAGRGGGEIASRATDQVEQNAGSYFTGADFGSPDERYAGPIGKTLLVAAVQGRDPTDFGGWNLDAESRARMQTSGDQAGRFSDQSGSGDFSNGFGQALNIMGLARTPGGVPTQAVSFLLDQQCPAGGFRLSYDSSAVCETDDEIDPDATAFAVQALLTSTVFDGVQQAISDATEWLASAQEGDGGFAGVGTGGSSSNTTGIVAQALLAVGETNRAGAAHAWIEARQLTSGEEAGAIARDDGDFGTGGIADGSRDRWRRATAQGVLGLGLQALSRIGLTVPPATAALNRPSAAPGDEVSVFGALFALEEAVTVTIDDRADTIASGVTDDRGQVVISLVVPALDPGEHQVVLSGAASGARAADTFTVVAAQASTTSTTARRTTTPTTRPPAGAASRADGAKTGGAIAATGTDPAVPGTLGLTAVIAGLLLLSLAKVRRCERSHTH